MYYDTDSIIYLEKKNEYNPKLGDFLGDFTNELNVSEFISEFVSAGPKKYSFKKNLGNTKFVVKGISLHYTALKVINF